MGERSIRSPARKVEFKENFDLDEAFDKVSSLKFQRKLRIAVQPSQNTTSDFPPVSSSKSLQKPKANSLFSCFKSIFFCSVLLHACCIYCILGNVFFCNDLNQNLCVWLVFVSIQLIFSKEFEMEKKSVWLGGWEEENCPN